MIGERTGTVSVHSIDDHLLVRLVVIIGVLGILHTVLDKLFKRGFLTDELNEFRDTATTA